MTPGHLASRDEVRHVETRDREIGLQTVRVEDRELIGTVERADLGYQFGPFHTQCGELS